ncbi:MAG TPA: glyoxalase [Candidatus Alectryocaccobium stercorigallinarum]|jgi:hypothetical protein|nr:glyoxalase [Candidatus Alectryocaccobium stercorigallinarum]
MDYYSDECISYFFENQSQLFDEPVAENIKEAREFLEDCMAVVVDSIDEVREYLEDAGMDVSGLSDEELEEESEVFAIPDGTYLIVEG